MAIGKLIGAALVAAATATPITLVQPESVLRRDEPERLVTIERINSIKAAQNSWRAIDLHDYTRPFYNWTLPQVQRLLNPERIPSGANGDEPDAWSNQRHILPIKDYSHVNASSLPDRFDSREKWFDCQTIPLVRDQGDCGSCWAFGSTTPMSDRLCIHSNGTIQDLVSARDLMSCCSYCLGNVTAGGCEGGFSQDAYYFWMTEGIVSGDNYGSELGCQPYPIPINLHHRAFHVASPICMRECTNDHIRPYKQDKFRAKEVYRLPAKNEAAAQWEIMTSGPITAGYAVYDDFPLYKDGVYVQTSQKKVGGHDVTILGWGEENGLKYWLVKNSWNRLWGHHGFFKIRRGTNECGIEDEMVAGIPDV